MLHRGYYPTFPLCHVKRRRTLRTLPLPCHSAMRGHRPPLRSATSNGIEHRGLRPSALPWQTGRSAETNHPPPVPPPLPPQPPPTELTHPHHYTSTVIDAAHQPLSPPYISALSTAANAADTSPSNPPSQPPSMWLMEPHYNHLNSADAADVAPSLPLPP
jgi:hypothetical protein